MKQDDVNAHAPLLSTVVCLPDPTEEKQKLSQEQTCAGNGRLGSGIANFGSLDTVAGCCSEGEAADSRETSICSK